MSPVCLIVCYIDLNSNGKVRNFNIKQTYLINNKVRYFNETIKIH